MNARYILYIGNVHVDTVGAEYIKMSALDSSLYAIYDEFRITFAIYPLEWPF